MLTHALPRFGSCYIESYLGNLDPLVLYLPRNANTALREMGIVLLLAYVGLKAGEHFMEILVHGDGLLWMVLAQIMILFFII